MRSRIFNAASSLVGAALLLAAAVGNAAPTIYSAAQAPKSPLNNNPTPPTLSPAMVLASAQYGIATTELGRNEYENGALAGPGSFTYNNGLGTATLSGGSVVGAAQSAPGSGRYNMTRNVPNDPTAGGPYGHWLEASSDFSYSFSVAVNALSFFTTDLGDLKGRFALKLYSGSTLLFSSADIVNAELDAFGRGNGNLLFFGIVSDVAFDKATFSITQQVGNPNVDVIGFDSLVVSTANVPEPASLALVGLALAGAGLTMRKREKARSAA